MPSSYPSSLTDMMAAMQLQPEIPSGACSLSDAYAVPNFVSVMVPCVQP